LAVSSRESQKAASDNFYMASQQDCKASTAPALGFASSSRQKILWQPGDKPHGFSQVCRLGRIQAKDPSPRPWSYLIMFDQGPRTSWIFDRCPTPSQASEVPRSSPLPCMQGRHAIVGCYPTRCTHCTLLVIHQGNQRTLQATGTCQHMFYYLCKNISKEWRSHIQVQAKKQPILQVLWADV